MRKTSHKHGMTNLHDQQEAINKHLLEEKARLVVKFTSKIMAPSSPLIQGGNFNVSTIHVPDMSSASLSSPLFPLWSLDNCYTYFLYTIFCSHPNPIIPHQQISKLDITSILFRRFIFPTSIIPY